MKRLLWIPWRWWRRAAQFAALALFMWLFRLTAYTGEDYLSGGENIFFRLDPLAGATAMLAARDFLTAFWPALVILALTVVLGRFFCGWICPLGTLLDYFHRLLRPIARRTNRWCGTTGSCGTAALGCEKIKSASENPQPGAAVLHKDRRSRLRSTRYILLIVVLLSAVFSYSLVGLVDPFALLFRGLTFWGDPMFFDGMYFGLEWIDGRWGVEKIEPFIEESVLPFRSNVFMLAGVSAAILGVIFALELVARRFWCRYLCPLGALLGLCGRWSLVKRLPAGACKTCGHCASICRMDALGDGLSPEDCTLCMECVDLCPKRIVKFRIIVAQPPSAVEKSTRQPGAAVPHFRPINLSRRGVLAGLAAGAAIPALAAVVKSVGAKETDPYLLRPPGAGDEGTFLDLCIRCGECMKVCPTAVLQPAVLESGVEGIFSPRLVPRFVFEQTYCELSCTLCGQACPTGAIPLLSEEAKYTHPIGKAYFDHSRCLPWGKETPCIRCEEMCPVPEKAIKIINTYTITDADGFELEIQQPYVERDLCVGCGICESNCPVEPVDGPSAIRVRRVGAPYPGTETKLESTHLSDSTPKSPSGRPRAW